MHVYKRNLTPIRENYQHCTTTTPFEDNFVVFSNNFGHHHFKQEYMNLHGDNVQVNSSSKNKHFQTFSVLSQKVNDKVPAEIKPPLQTQLSNGIIGEVTTSDTTSKKSNFLDNMKKLKEARKATSPELKKIKAHQIILGGVDPHQTQQSFSLSRPVKAGPIPN